MHCGAEGGAYDTGTKKAMLGPTGRKELELGPGLMGMSTLDAFLLKVTVSLNSVFFIFS